MYVVITQNNGLTEIVTRRIVMRVADYALSGALNVSEFDAAGSLLVGTGVGTVGTTGAPPQSGMVWISDLNQTTKGKWELIDADTSGWFFGADTWTRVDNFSFTVAGDVTEKYKAGTRVRWADGSGSLEYGVVKSATYADPTTTITLMHNETYALDDAEITNGYLSYMDQPGGLPTMFYYNPTNGWLLAGDVWTRTGNHTFTVSGDVTARYRKGAKVRYKDGGSYEYGVIKSVSYADPTTTITLISNDNYAMAAATITDKYISYVENPESFPHGFDWTPTPTGYSVTTTAIGRWSVQGNLIHISFNVLGNSNATTFTITNNPVSNPLSNTIGFGLWQAQDGSTLTTAARGTIASASSTITLRSNMSTGAWNNTDIPKQANAYFVMEF